MSPTSPDLDFEEMHARAGQWLRAVIQAMVWPEEDFANGLPRGYPYLRDQWKRARAVHEYIVSRGLDFYFPAQADEGARLWLEMGGVPLPRFVPAPGEGWVAVVEPEAP